MQEFIVRTADQLPTLIQAWRKTAGLTQAEAAARLGVTQQTYSALERNAPKMSAERLLKLVNLLGGDLVLRSRRSQPDAPPAKAPQAGPTW